MNRINLSRIVNSRWFKLASLWANITIPTLLLAIAAVSVIAVTIANNRATKAERERDAMGAELAECRSGK